MNEHLPQTDFATAAASANAITSMPGATATDASATLSTPTTAQNTPDTSAAEELLSSWTMLNLLIRENRFLQQLSFNQMALCRLLQAHPEGQSAADLCRRTGLLKSQMNKELQSLEDKLLITKKPHPRDRRKTVIMLSEGNESLYDREHDRVMQLFSQISASLGEEDTRQLSHLLEHAVHAALPHMK